MNNNNNNKDENPTRFFLNFATLICNHRPTDKPFLLNTDYMSMTGVGICSSPRDQKLHLPTYSVSCFFFFLLPSPPCSNPSNHILLPSSINVMCYYTCSNAALFCCRVAMICSSPAHHVYTQRVELGKCRAICSWWWLCACMMMMREAKERYRERKTALAHERVMWLATVTHRSPTWSESSIMYHTHSHANNIHETCCSFLMYLYNNKQA